jgi:hypothetical protein
MSSFTSVAQCDDKCYFQQPIVAFSFTSKCPTVTFSSIFSCTTVAFYFTSSCSSVMSSFNSSTTTIMWWLSFLRYFATSQKVAGSIPDGVVRIFHWCNPSGRTMAMGLTQPPSEMSTSISWWGKGGRCVGLTTLPYSCAKCLEIWESYPPGTLTAFRGL